MAGGKMNAIAKVCSVLRSLSANSSLRLSQISSATGLNRVTALRILEELSDNGFIERKGTPPRYSFGPEVLAMAASVSRAHDITNIVRPSLLRLAEYCGDTVLLSVRSGAQAICIDRASGSFPIRANFLDIGSRRPLGIGAGSTALLAWLPKAEKEAILEITCNRLEDFPDISEDVLNQHIEKAIETGYVVMVEVVIEKMGGIGYPIRDAQGGVVAAISIAALTERILEREVLLLAELKREIRKIEIQLTRSSEA